MRRDYAELRKEILEGLWREGVSRVCGCPGPGSFDARYWMRRPKTSKARAAIGRAREMLRKRNSPLLVLCELMADDYVENQKVIDGIMDRISLLYMPPLHPGVLMYPVSA